MIADCSCYFTPFEFVLIMRTRNHETGHYRDVCNRLQTHKFVKHIKMSYPVTPIVVPIFEILSVYGNRMRGVTFHSAARNNCHFLVTLLW